MDNIVLYCKSFNRDLNRVKVLVDSIDKFNQDKISFYISVPNSDYNLFRNTLGNDINLIPDEEIYDNKNLGENWYTQQIIKSNFWKLKLCKNYVCLDSDSYFIKSFNINDFIFDEDIPYTVIHEQKELFSWSSSKIELLGFDPKNDFINDRQKIMNGIFERNGKIYDFGPSPVIWSAKVWADLEEKYIKPNNLAFEKLLEYSPSEFSWYGESLLNFHSISLHPIEPLFKVFHYPQQYIEYKQNKITEEMISQNYFGIVMQSNFNSPIKY